MLFDKVRFQGWRQQNVAAAVCGSPRSSFSGVCSKGRSIDQEKNWLGPLAAASFQRSARRPDCGAPSPTQCPVCSPPSPSLLPPACALAAAHLREAADRGAQVQDDQHQRAGRPPAHQRQPGARRHQGARHQRADPGGGQEPRAGRVHTGHQGGLRRAGAACRRRPGAATSPPVPPCRTPVFHAVCVTQRNNHTTQQQELVQKMESAGWRERWGWAPDCSAERPCTAGWAQGCGWQMHGGWRCSCGGVLESGREGGRLSRGVLSNCVLAEWQPNCPIHLFTNVSQ